jgi:hypothetical protein
MMLAGTLAMPERALGIVLFAHGSGSSRHVLFALDEQIRALTIESAKLKLGWRIQNKLTQ